jgi:hypothetical protein
MGTVDDFISIIKKKEGFRFDKQVAEFIGIDKHSLANAKLRDKLPNSYIMWFCETYNIEIKDFHKEITLTNTDIQLKGDDSMDARYVIDLQKEKIERQTVEIDRLKSALEHKEAESTHWDLIEFDYYIETKIYLKNMVFSRTINEVTNLELQSQKLGYTVDELKELWDVGNSYMFDSELPLKKMLDENTLKDINEKTRTFPAIFNTLKNIVGHHYIPMPVIYLHKNGNKVPAISYNKIKWSEMKVYSKVEYIKVD